MLTVPLKTRGQVIGVMRLSTAERREFSPSEIAIMEAVASFCTSAIIHTMFSGILERVNGVIRSSRDLDALLQSIVSVVSEVYIPGYQKTDFPVAVRPEYIPPPTVPRAPPALP